MEPFGFPIEDTRAAQMQFTFATSMGAKDLSVDDFSLDPLKREPEKPEDLSDKAKRLFGAFATRKLEHEEDPLSLKAKALFTKVGKLNGKA